MQTVHPFSLIILPSTVSAQAELPYLILSSLSTTDLSTYMFTQMSWETAEHTQFTLLQLLTITILCLKSLLQTQRWVSS